MIKIGIIGAESNHATSFATALNLPDAEGNYRYEDVRVIKVYGADGSAERLAAKSNIPEISDTPDDFDDCDSIMLTTRWGSRHYAQAIDYIRKGMNLYIDKPFAVSVEEAEQLVAEAKKSGSLLCGGSGCKYAPDVIALAEKVKKLRESGALATASINFPVRMNIEYDGFFFYSHHLIETVFTLFGKDIVCLQASRKADTVIATLQYEDIQITLHFDEGVWDSTCTLYTKSGIIHEPIDISTVLDEALDVYVQMLRSNQQPYPLEDLIDPVIVADAIWRSYTMGEKITLRPAEQ